MFRTVLAVAVSLSALMGSDLAKADPASNISVAALAESGSGNVLALATNPARAYRGELPRAEELITHAGFSGSVTQWSVNASWTFRYEASTNGMLIGGFQFTSGPVRSAQQLGLGNVASFTPLFDAYFAQFPGVDFAVAWIETGTAVAGSLSGSYTSSNTLPKTLYPFTPCSDQVPMALAVSGSPVGDGVMGLYIEGVVSDLTVCFAADLMGEFGHAYVELVGESGQPVVRGKYPTSKISAVLGGPAVIGNDAHRNCVRRICYRVTAEQYSAVSRFVTAQTAAPSDYHPFTANCVDWIREAATQAGIALPNSSSLGIDRPSVLLNSLAAITSPVARCGVAAACTLLLRSPLETGTGTPPQSWDTGILFALILDDPAAAGASLEVPVFDHSTPIAASLVAGQTLEVRIEGIEQQRFMFGASWGDGSQSPLSNSATVARPFASPGAFAARLVAVEDGGIHVYALDLTVQTGAGSGTEPLVISVDDMPDASVANGDPSYAAAGDIPLPSVESCQTDCNVNSVPDCDEPHPLAGLDCNRNGILDACDISSGTSLDVELDGICDECQQVACLGDGNSDGVVSFADITKVLENWGATYPPAIGAGPGDANDDGTVNFADITDVILAWGQTCD